MNRKYEDSYYDTLADNNGGSTDYYKLPTNAKDLQDLIEYKKMSWNMGNVFKSCYRYGDCSHSDKLRDANKILWFIKREISLLNEIQKG